MTFLFYGFLIVWGIGFVAFLYAVRRAKVEPEADYDDNPWMP